MADHLHNWYVAATTRERSNDSSNDVDMKMLKENIHVIQVSYEIFKGAHLTQECPVRKEEKTVEQIKALDATTKNLQVKADQLTQTALTNEGDMGKTVKVKTKKGKEVKKEPVPCYLPIINPYVPPTPFPRNLKEHKDDPYNTRKTIFMIEILEKTHEAQGKIMIKWTWMKVGILRSRM
ncbi:hypothetical protein Tco_0598389 [Tanacetum coccineum]